MKTIAARALAAFLFALLLAPTAPAQTLPSSTYACTAELGDVLLDGRYPLTAGELPGTLELQTSPTGVLTGKADILGLIIDVTGTIRERANSIRVVLRGRLATKRFLLKATLQGNAFVGTAQLGNLRTVCRIEATASGPTRLKYALTLTVAANGAIRGTGNLSAARQQIPVTARGRVTKGVASLTIRGGKTVLQATRGQLTGGGFIAGKWMGQGFGALTKGVNLSVMPAAP